MGKRLTEQQREAIKYLAQPQHGGLKYDEIAERVGVSRMSLYRWRSELAFQDELKREIGRNTLAQVPDVIAAMIESAVKNKSSNAAKLVLQSLGMLTDKVEVNDGNSRGANADIDAMKAEIERIKQRRK